jgi:hypothetical protein
MLSNAEKISDVLADPRRVGLTPEVIANPKVRGGRAGATGVELLLTVTYAKTFGHRPTLDELRPSRGFSAFQIAYGQPRRLFAATRLAGIPPVDSLFDMPEQPDEKTISILHIEIAPEGA